MSEQVAVGRAPVEAGPEMDGAISRTVFKQPCVVYPGGAFLGKGGALGRVPAYSTDIASAMSVLERMREIGYTVEMRMGSNDRQAWVHLIGPDWKHPNASALEPSFALAACRAALLALTSAAGARGEGKGSDHA